MTLFAVDEEPPRIDNKGRNAPCRGYISRDAVRGNPGWDCWNRPTPRITLGRCARQLELNLAACVRLTKAILNREIRRTVVECLKSRIGRRISSLISATTTQINPKIRSALYGRAIARSYGGGP